MKKAPSKDMSKKDDIKSEYDFSTMKGEVRGKYYKKYREGNKIEINHEGGSKSVQYFKLEDGAVMLEPDVREYFSDSKSVNKALRSIILLLTHQYLFSFAYCTVCF